MTEKKYHIEQRRTSSVIKSSVNSGKEQMSDIPMQCYESIIMVIVFILLTNSSS